MRKCTDCGKEMGSTFAFTFGPLWCGNCLRKRIDARDKRVKAFMPVDYFADPYAPFVHLDHCPPPGPVMLIMVRTGIQCKTLRAPELRPWMFSGGFQPHDQWKLTKGVCGWCTTSAGGNIRRTFHSQWLELAAPEAKDGYTRWLWGQCPACETIFWGCEDDRVLAWINGERKYDPRQPICKKPAINVPGREAFRKVWEAAA